MAGIAYGQLLHLAAPITVASWMIFVGVVGTVYAVYIVWRDERMLPETKAIVELEDFEAHSQRPSRRRRWSDD
jgi:type VI protein secretion system component VasK